MNDLLTIREASSWASEHLGKDVTPSNILYLVQYGRIPRHGENGTVIVSQEDLSNYYENARRETAWREKLGKDLNWALSFDNLKEKETTKHVHRLHPYKGKFIPQLVEYFIDNHRDNFKTKTYFRKGDIILDPFSGSGTALVQANELGIHAVGIDISAFNSLIANVKVSKINFQNLNNDIKKITNALSSFVSKHKNIKFENELLYELNIFNKRHFPSPEFKIRVRCKDIIEQDYVPAKEKEFTVIYDKLRKKYRLNIEQGRAETFLEKWYIEPIRKELDFVHEQLKAVKNPATQKILTVILSRTIRSCRATTHSDLATLKEPVTKTYYCTKHGKICKPLFSIFSWWQRYCKDTVNRLHEFDKLRTNTRQMCLQGDSRNIDLLGGLSAKEKDFAKLIKKQKIRGIFSSPPYVGLIDYHEQHAYAYDLFGFERNDSLELGALFKGQGKEARNSYIKGIVQTLNHSKQYLQKNYDIFLVANDKYNMYPTISEKSGMRIVNQYKRPVLNRTEKDKSAYAETIFHLKEK